jgi:dihydroorotase
MVHIGGMETRALMTEILDLLRPGDILTHCYTGAPNLAGDFTNIVQDGRLLRRRWRPKSAVWSSMSAPAAASIITLRRPPLRKAARPTRSPPTSTLFPATRRACMSKFLGLGFPLIR